MQGPESFIVDLQRIQSAGRHLLELINGILDLSKIEAGKMALSVEAFDVRSMIDELLDTVDPLVQKNHNTLTVNCPAEIGTMQADLTKTRQILLNLLSNAGKFTRAGTIVLDVDRRVLRRLSVHRVHRHRHRRRHDQGSRRRRSSTRSRRPTSRRRRKYGGTGLGLALVSRFCHLMGGEVLRGERTRRRIQVHGPPAGRRRAGDLRRRR